MPSGAPLRPHDALDTSIGIGFQASRTGDAAEPTICRLNGAVRANP
ncbi:hypothetical protein [Umezawaea sp. NPDC059074]